MRKRLVQDERGFTMVELLIVAMILSSLASLAVPEYLGFQQKADKAAATSNVATFAQDVQRYAEDNFPGVSTAKDPDWNGTDAAGTGTNADTSYADTWAGTTVVTRVAAKYDPSVSTSVLHWDPAGWAPTAGQTTSTDYCIYAVVGPYYAAQHGAGGAISSGKTLHLANDGTCTAS